MAWVFPSQVGTPMEPRNLQRHWHGLRRRLDLQGVRLHDLRHSYASFLLAAGVPMRVVMEMLGHSSMTLTANSTPMCLTAFSRRPLGGSMSCSAALGGPNRLTIRLTG